MRRPRAWYDAERASSEVVVFFRPPLLHTEGGTKPVPPPSAGEVLDVQFSSIDPNLGFGRSHTEGLRQRLGIGGLQ